MSIRAAEKVVRNYASASITPEMHYHSTIIPVDAKMRGSVRYGRAVGTDEVTIYAANSMTLANVLSPGDVRMRTTSAVTDRTAGCVVKLPDTSLILVNSVVQQIGIDGTPSWSWTIDELTPVRSQSQAGDQVTAYGYPCSITDAGSDLIQISSTTVVVPGDTIIPMQLSKAGLIEGRGATIKSITSSTVTPQGNVYSAAVDKDMKPILLSSVTYVKADCAYQSRLISAAKLNGAFFADMVSGTTMGTEAEDVHLTVTVHKSDYSVAKSYPNVKKNTPILLGSVQACDLATGIVDKGRVLPMPDGSLWCILDDDGLCGFGYDFIVPTVLGVRLEVSGVPGTRVAYETDQVGDTYSLTTAGCVIDLATTAIDHLIVRLTGQAGGIIVVKNSQLDEDHSFLSYSFVSHTNQAEEWGGSGLILKPIVAPISDSSAIVNGTTFVVGGGAFL